MTKERDPMSIEQALRDAIAAITPSRAIEVTGRKLHYIRRLSDADERTQLTVRDALAIDREYDRTVGGRPILGAMTQLLDAQADGHVACVAILLEATADSVRDSAAAHAAVIASAVPGATIESRRRALREVARSIAAKSRLTPILQRFLGRSPQPP